MRIPDQNFISTCCRYGGVGLSGIIKSVICVWGLEAGIILPSQGKHKYFKAHMILIPLKLIWNIPDFLLKMRW